MTKIVNCTCFHEYQDAKHGRGRRAANSCKDDKEWRCTACGNVVTNQKAVTEKK
jgi:hypothetical protein